ncbi:MAG: hypothetical protein H6961_03235 [Chromatiaceae bacterium]|nr:hypothetical protein [Chromatiaceae bacterium]
MMRFVRWNIAVLLGACILAVPVLGVVWVTGLPGSNTPTFLNLAIRAMCEVPIAPTIHFQIPGDNQSKRDLTTQNSQMRLAIQFFPELFPATDSVCSSVSIFVTSLPLSPEIVIAAAPDAASPPLWFYIDAVGSYSKLPVNSERDPNGWGWSVKLDNEQLKVFLGAITFELNDVVEKTSLSNRTLSVSTLLQGISTTSTNPVTIGTSITIPPDFRLIQDLSIPTPVNVLASNRGPRYEFSLVESRLGNTANAGHWVSFHAVLEDTVWAKWQQYLLFVFSGLFGFGVGFFLEALLARRKQQAPKR